MINQLKIIKKKFTIRTYNKKIAIKNKTTTIATEIIVVNFIKFNQVFFCESMSITNLGVL